ncbi:MAG: DUF177 domain-containing protein [Bacteroidaceae bacterium]|nr:DUF177 domain-containing protein [Bacteroidaceae bacterium]
MERSKQFVINLRDQKADKAEYGWTVDDDFFRQVGATEVQRGLVEVTLTVRRTSGAFELTFGLKGHVVLPCDHCMEDMQQPIEAEQTLKVKLGDQYDDDGELVTVAYADGTLDVAWHLYEMIALEIPLRHVHAECDGED